MIAKNSPDAGKATDFEKVLQNVLEKGWISRENLETSLIMMSGDKWSRYVATLADTSQATTKGYVEYLTDNYPDIDLAKPEQARKAVEKNAQIPP